MPNLPHTIISLHTIYRGFSIAVGYAGCKTIGYRIQQPDGRELAGGYTDAAVKPLRFVRELAGWLDIELQKIAAIGRSVQ